MEQENALDRLMRESESDKSEQFSMDEIIESEETNFLENMSENATSMLKERIQPVKVDEDYEDVVENEIVEEEVKRDEPKKEITSKPKKNLRGKKNKDAKYDTFMNSLANECIDIMIQSGTTIHGFSQSQMNLIWDYIKERLN